MNKNIDALNLEELHTLLKEVKLYQDLSKKLGKRGRELYKRTKDGKSLYVVEYFSKIDTAYVTTTALEVYKAKFNASPDVSEIQLVEKDELGGGMKVYMDDTMVDLSFSKIEKLVK